MSAHSEDFLRVAAEARKHIQEVAPEAAAELARQGALILDIREKEEYEASHLLGSRHLSRGVLEMRIHQLAPRKDTHIVCYCAGGNRGALAAKTLQDLGYRNAYSIQGGLNACSLDLVENQANLAIPKPS